MLLPVNRGVSSLLLFPHAGTEGVWLQTGSMFGVAPIAVRRDWANRARGSEYSGCRPNRCEARLGQPGHSERVGAEAASGKVGNRTLQLRGKPAQGCAQPFFEDRMIKRHSQEILNREALLNSQRQQVGQVLALGGAHLGAEQ